MAIEPTTPVPVTDTPLDSGGGALVPGWLQRLAAFGWRVLVIVAMVLVVTSVAVQQQIVIGSILFAFIVVATVAPVYERMVEQRGWTPIKASAAVSAVALGIIVLIVVLVAAAFAPYVVTIIHAAQQGIANLTSTLQAAGVPPAVTDVLDTGVSLFEGWLASAAKQVVGPIANLVTIFILGGFLTFYLLVDGAKGWRLTLKDLDDWREEALTRRASLTFDRIGGYLRGTGVTAATDAATDWVFLTLMGVPLASPLAVMVFLFGFVPYIGSVIAAVILVLVTLATKGALAAAILVGLIVATNVVRKRVLGDSIYGGAVPVHPALVITALPVGAALFGLPGLIAAVPIVIVAESVAPAIVEALSTAKDQQRPGGLVPTWLDRLAQWSWRGLVVLAFVGLAVQVAVTVPGVIIPVVLALILAATFAPAVDLLIRRGVNRTRSSIIVTVSSAAIVVVVLAVTVLAIAGSMSDMVGQAAAGAQKIGIGTTPSDVVVAVGSGLIENAAALLSSFIGLAIAILLAMLLTFYFLSEGPGWWQRILDRVPSRNQSSLAAAGSQSAGILNGYMVGTGIIALFAAVTQWLIMVLLGLPLAFPIAVLTFFGNFIPYIGGAITTLLGFLVAVAVGTTTDIALMGIYTLVMNIVQGNFVAPQVYGKTVSLHPAIVLMAIPAGGAVAGIIGMFLVVPFLGIVATTWRLVLHMFDPEGSPSPVASGSAPVREGPEAAPATTVPPGTQAEPSTSP
jgi:predicted PurR-regulated permease PerM